MTHLGCDRIYSETFIANCLLILTVKEFWKSVNIQWSCEVYKKLCHFLAHPVDSNRQERRRQGRYITVVEKVVSGCGGPRDNRRDDDKNTCGRPAVRPWLSGGEPDELLWVLCRRNTPPVHGSLGPWPVQRRHDARWTTHAVGLYLSVWISSQNRDRQNREGQNYSHYTNPKRNLNPSPISNPILIPNSIPKPKPISVFPGFVESPSVCILHITTVHC